MSERPTLTLEGSDDWERAGSLSGSTLRGMHIVIGHNARLIACNLLDCTFHILPGGALDSCNVNPGQGSTILYNAEGVKIAPTGG
jgi:hypothetical protein